MTTETITKQTFHTEHGVFEVTEIETDGKRQSAFWFADCEDWISLRVFAKKFSDGWPRAMVFPGVPTVRFGDGCRELLLFAEALKVALTE